MDSFKKFYLTYPFQPAVYVAESAISSGTAGSSSDGSEKTAAVAAGFAFIAIAAASFVLLLVGKNSPPVQTADYTGPALSYYISKFKQLEIIPAAAPAPSETESPSSALPESLVSEVSQVEVQSKLPSESSSVITTS